MNITVVGLDLSDSKNVLLLAPEQMESEEEIFELRRILADRFPACTFTILGGGFKLVATTNDDVVFEIEA